MKDIFEEKIKEAVEREIYWMNTFDIDYDEYIDSIAQSILNIPEIKKALEHWKEMHMLPKGE